jgi:hypothetical protein
LKLALAAAGVLALTLATSASALTVSQREYKRGYADCAAGRWDENQHGESYKKGCRAAEDKRDVGGSPATTAAASGSPDAMLSICKSRAAKTYRTRADAIEVKYEGQRVDGTHAVNGSNTASDPAATFQCSFNRAGNKIVKFIRNRAPSVSSHDTKVPGTNFHATGDIPCATVEGQPMSSCHFGVVRRGNGDATVTVFLPGGAKRNIRFTNGKAVSSDSQAGITSEKSADLNRVFIGTTERYEVPDAVLFGG